MFETLCHVVRCSDSWHDHRHHHHHRHHQLQYSVRLNGASHSVFCSFGSSQLVRSRVLLGFVQFFLSNDIWNHLVQREIHDQVNQARFTMALLGMDKWMKIASLFVRPAPFFMEVMDAAEAKHADTVIFAPARNRRDARG